MVDERQSRTETETAEDRRRAGRVAYQNPHLINLLRALGAKPDPLAPDPSASMKKFRGDLAPAYGVIAGLLLALALWFALGGLVLLVWDLLR